MSSEHAPFDPVPRDIGLTQRAGDILQSPPCRPHASARHGRPPVDTLTPRLLRSGVPLALAYVECQRSLGAIRDGVRPPEVPSLGAESPHHRPAGSRAQAILRAVIEEYVTTAVPVGSPGARRALPVGVSSATVRNILAELELEGSSTHPHTSAGRVPTDAGYRYYVESIVGDDAAPAGRAADDPPPVRPGRVRQRALVPPRGHDARLGHPGRRAGHAGQAARRARSGGSISSRSASGWPASSSSSARGRSSRRCSRSTPGTSDDELAEAAGRLNAAAGGSRPPIWPSACAGSTRLRKTTPSSRSPAGSGARILRIVREYDGGRGRGGLQRRPAQRDGRAGVRPETEKLRRVFAALENRAYLGELVERRAPGGSRVFIGHENRRRRDAGRVARARAVRPAGPRRRRGGRPRAHAHALRAGDRHGPLRVRADERTGGSPLCLTRQPMPSTTSSRRSGGRRPDARPPRRSATAQPPARPRVRRRGPRAERDAARPRPTSTSPLAPARARPTSRTSGAGPRRSARRCSASPNEGLLSQGGRPRRRLRPRDRARPRRGADDRLVEGIAAIDRKLRAAPRERGRDRRSRRSAGRSTRASTRRSPTCPAPAGPRARSSPRSGAATGSATGSSGRPSSP